MPHHGDSLYEAPKSCTSGEMHDQMGLVLAADNKNVVQ
jgi:hypothetical protein